MPVVHRLFVESANIADGFANIASSDVNYLKNVLRLKAGDQLIICTGESKSFVGNIYKIEPFSITARIEKELEENNEPKTRITLAQSLPKGHKFDSIIQKSVELGVFEIIPVLTERSIPKIDQNKNFKIPRWQIIAKEAAKQCQRSFIPKIQPIVDFITAVNLIKDFDYGLIFWELEREQTLKSFLSKLSRKTSNRIIILTGPEGGFSQNEVAAAKNAGFISLSLGKRILRSETAPLFVLANILYELEQ